MDKKKIILVVVAVIVVVLVAYFASKSTPSLQPSGQPTATGESAGGPDAPVVTDQGTVTPQGVVAAPGTSPIAESGQVVTAEGKPVKLDVTPGTPEAPQQSNPIASPAELPRAAVKVSISSAGFEPTQFSVKSGEAVTVSITSSDTQTHVFKFDDPSLEAVAIGVGPGETRAITFPAPKAGTYKFHCDVPGHAGRGEVGEMVVR